MIGRTPLPQGRTLLERTAFLNWQAMSLLLVGLSVGLGVASVRSLRSVRASRPGASLTIMVWVCLAALAALFVVGASISPGSWTVLRGIDQHLRAAGSVAWAESGLGRLTFLPMRFSVAASILVATAMLTLLMHPPKTRPHVVAERLQRLKLLLYLTAITLAAGVLATRAGYLWLFSFLVEGPKDDFWVQAGTLVQAASLRVGVLYSLYLAMLYLPVHWLLQRQAESLVVNRPGAPAPAGAGGVASGELTLRNWQETVAQFVALVAPAVTGAASNLIALKLG